MHELSLSENLREIIETEAEHQKFSRVETVRLAVGQLSCVEPEALRFCFDEVMRGTLAEGARLEILPVPGLGRCPRCDRTEAMSELYDLCPACQMPLTVEKGLEIRLRELEVC
ncbi:hydrogenase maturation nickel metallochaperone HypA [Methylohalobius crimeensis]|uniref:hydrogenase maturation nickel metallochaperone HypA n=1 Tax=Methylohalobius crimeensis TaxID=244365 RepID=UPI0003B64AAF|nr:hydrogenase maturation nickel metallochaperone HypA [Methylohalobius crimeensis]